MGSFLPEKTLCHAQALPGAWVVGQSAGGCRNNSCFPCNPKYWLRLSEPSELCVAVLQRPRKHPAGRARALVGRGPAPSSLLAKDYQAKDYQAVGLHIWKVNAVGTGLHAGTLPRALSRTCLAVVGFHTLVFHSPAELRPSSSTPVPQWPEKSRTATRGRGCRSCPQCLLGSAFQ